jgi:hypothetical protein
MVTEHSGVRRWNMRSRILGGALCVLMSISACSDTHARPATGTKSVSSGPPALRGLSRIPWEGGSRYWSQFRITRAAGWAKPSFFPIAIWWDVIGSNAEARFDKSYGINSYVETNPSVPYRIFADNHLFWIGDKLNKTYPAKGTAWAGDFIDDEIDGRYTPVKGRAYIRSRLRQMGHDGRFRYANFSSIVAGDYNAPQIEASNLYVNMYRGPVSVDSYWYTDPRCSVEPYVDYSFAPINKSHCRTSSSYGATVRSVRARDASDHRYKPVWAFVETMGGGTESTPTGIYIKPGQIEGAAMNSIINEARGIIYFNQSFQGPCQNGNLLRSVQTDPHSCAAPQMRGMRRINRVITRYAPVLNTQSFRYRFGSDLETMLKWYRGSAYVFAMISGAKSSEPGRRHFVLPPGLRGAKRVTVVGERRSIPVASGGFDDTFAHEYNFHIYRITPPQR